MNELIRQAGEFLVDRYVKPVHTVASALETEDGKIYLGLNIDHFSGFVCAEMSVLATAMNQGEKSFTKIAAVRKNENGLIVIANPCGKCRQILYDFTPGIEVSVTENNESTTRRIEELLPFGFQRTREKIQLALNGERAEEVVG